MSDAFDIGLGRTTNRAPSASDISTCCTRVADNMMRVEAAKGRDFAERRIGAGPDDVELLHATCIRIAGAIVGSLSAEEFERLTARLQKRRVVA